MSQNTAEKDLREVLQDVAKFFSTLGPERARLAIELLKMDPPPLSGLCLVLKSWAGPNHTKLLFKILAKEPNYPVGIDWFIQESLKDIGLSSNLRELREDDLSETLVDSAIEKWKKQEVEDSQREEFKAADPKGYAQGLLVGFMERGLP